MNQYTRAHDDTVVCSCSVRATVKSSGFKGSGDGGHVLDQGYSWGWGVHCSEIEGWDWGRGNVSFRQEQVQGWLRPLSPREYQHRAAVCERTCVPYWQCSNGARLVAGILSRVIGSALVAFSFRGEPCPHGARGGSVIDVVAVVRF